jgi:hypothetical protein
MNEGDYFSRHRRTVYHRPQDSWLSVKGNPGGEISDSICPASVQMEIAFLEHE